MRSILAVTLAAAAALVQAAFAGAVLAPVALAAAPPYTLGGPLPRVGTSPRLAADAPYTPLVRSLISQLEPTNPPTIANITNAARLFEGSVGPATGNTSCKAVGGIGAPVGTNPSIAPLCFADSVGVNILLPPNNGHTTATPEPLAIGSSFDPALANVWGQVEGAEGRRLMVTGLFGPEADVSIYPNWERGLDTLGEDPFVNEAMTAAQVNGIQSRGLMAQVKHFAAFTGADRYMLTQLGDQALHETLLKPFDAAFEQAGAASGMCAYEEFQDTSRGLPGPQDALNVAASPYKTSAVASWPLNEPHWACEQPLTLNRVLRHDWHSVAFITSDFPAIHSTSAMTEGAAQEFLTPTFFGNADPTPVLPPAATVGNGNDPTGDTCAIAGLVASCDTTGAQHVGGIPGPGCSPLDGCGLVNAVATGNLPLSVFNQALAEVLYQEQRFGLLGCDQSPVAATCTNPGGAGGDRSGSAGLAAGPAHGATAAANIGTEAGDGAVVERMAEEGSLLLKDSGHALPLSRAALGQGVSVTGVGAEYLIGAPSDEASTGFPDRIAVSPLAQLEALSGRGGTPSGGTPVKGGFSYTAAASPTGEPVPASSLSTVSGAGDGALSRTSGPGSPAKDAGVDFTAVSRAGQLASGSYSWSGYIYVPQADAYTFRFQASPSASSTAQNPVSFQLDGATQALSAPSSFYCGQYFPSNPQCVNVAATYPGYTEGGLKNYQTVVESLTSGWHQIQVNFDNSSSSPASFRFAYSRASGDLADAAAAAKGKAAAIVFVNDAGVTVVNQDADTVPGTGVATLPDADVRLIDAVAAANANTVVVMNTADPVIVAPWISNPHVRAVLETWNSGSEGGTATARLLLGQADPSGHSVLSWPAAPGDTIWGYAERRSLFPGDPLGAHHERLNGLTDTSAADCNSYTPAQTPCVKTILSEGIFSGYRFYDREHLRPQFPFGFGLSYTNFRFSGLRLRPRAGGLDVSFTIADRGPLAGADVAQVYLGPAGSLPGGEQQADRSLAAFVRVALRAGQSRRMTVHLGAGPARAGSGDPQAFQYWSIAKQAWVTNGRPRRVWVGDADQPSSLPLSGFAQPGR